MDKNIFSSTTVWAAILSLWIAISPTIKIMTNEGFKKTMLIDITDNAVATALVILGRYNAKTKIFTPKGLPGRDKSKQD